MGRVSWVGSVGSGQLSRVGCPCCRCIHSSTMKVEQRQLQLSSKQTASLKPSLSHIETQRVAAFLIPLTALLMVRHFTQWSCYISIVVLQQSLLVTTRHPIQLQQCPILPDKASFPALAFQHPRKVSFSTNVGCSAFRLQLSFGMHLKGIVSHIGKWWHWLQCKAL